MPQTLFLKPLVSAPLNNWRKSNVHTNCIDANIKMRREMEVVCMGMLAPRKFLRKRKKVEVFRDAADEADQKNWRRLMNDIEETGSAVEVLKSERMKNQEIPKDLVLGTLVRFKQLRKWKLVSEILEWLRTQNWWDFSEMDFLMLITAYGKIGDFNRAERVLSLMNKKGYAPSVISHTALMEAYGKGGRYNNAEAIFRRMKSSGPEPSPLTYQIILKIFGEGCKFKEAEEIFETLLNDKRSALKPDQKMFHMMIYMQKKAGSYEKARRLFALMVERGVPQSTVTYNSLMSFETNYKEVSKIYDQMQRSGLKPDVISYSLLVNAYGKARREEEALAVFEEMLDAGVRPTHKAYNVLLDAFAISGMVEQAQTVFKSMRRDRYTPDLCSYTTMLSAYVNASDMEGAEKFFTRLKQDGLKPNDVTYGTLIKGYARTNDIEKMMQKYEELKINGLKLNQKILTTIMDAYGMNRNFGSAAVWYKEIESCGFTPDQKAKNILLSLAKTAEEQNEANQLVGLVDRYSNKQRVIGVSRYDDDDDSDNDDNDLSDDEYDFPSNANFNEGKQDELERLVGDNEDLEALHMLKIC
ncbi:Tetratricopeptide-like helical domain containing protein [Parasponia andersonii]|uniref:Tetratricopeptide-like helical domain containing protein n=1 Tax=Parasponia andersonii TaxID=3476 RepID=A0A2P5C5W3_PARAD|nr:Tetratricopeptide-like helical domain containing protein [Parasponia andersonii]